jgi:cytochrome c oxidase assembly protein Cox11
MTKPTLRDLSTAELVQLFAMAATKQEDAILENDIAESIRLVWRMKAIQDELKQRPGDERSELMQLYHHPNMQARLHAAQATLAVAPQAARAQLEAIKASEWMPAAGDAGMSLRNLDSGVYKPK